MMKHAPQEPADVLKDGLPAPMINTVDSELENAPHSIIDGVSVIGDGGTVQGFDTTRGVALEPTFTLISGAQLKAATDAAERASWTFGALPASARAEFLRSIAVGIEERADAIVARAIMETALPEPRLRGELMRTTNQLRLLAQALDRGDTESIRIDEADPARQPLPRPGLVLRRVPLGPVAVFGASNFPLAFSTAGGDTAAALAAGCPVVFKAHNAHPGTSLLVAHAIVDAAAALHLDPGVFSLVFGRGEEIGQLLVADPAITAVAFTGSRTGGLALAATAAARKVPIPVYAEMSSINPVFILPGSIGDVSGSLAHAYVSSVTGSMGQLCTQPGLVFVPNGTDGDAFLEEVRTALTDATAHAMLTPSIAAACTDGTGRLAELDGVTLLAVGRPGPGEYAPAPIIFETSAARLLTVSGLQEEVFGPVSVVVRYNVEELPELIRALDGQLTASIQQAEEDVETARELLPRLERIAGRIIINGWPTGVELGDAIVHGGPFPATSDTRTTSVGTLAIDRFLRPVAFQDAEKLVLSRTDRPTTAAGAA